MRSSLASMFVVLPACNAVLGIDDATLCSGGSCDGGVPAMAEAGAPNLPGAAEGADASTDGAGGPGSGSEIVGPVQGVSAPGASEGSNAGSNSGSNGSGGGGAGGDGPALPPNPDGEGGIGAGASDGEGPGGEDELPPSPSPCEGRASGSAFCDGATRISCGPGASVAGTLPCPSVPHCTQSTSAACAACLTGDASCMGAILSVCNVARTGFDTTACAGPAQCNAAQARCEEPACSANQLRCDGSVLQICNATLTGFDPVIDCGSPAACNAQTGACNVCAPGARRCVDGDTVGICDSSGQAETRIDCTPLIESCVAGECELLGL